MKYRFRAVVGASLGLFMILASLNAQNGAVDISAAIQDINNFETQYENASRELLLAEDRLKHYKKLHQEVKEGFPREVRTLEAEQLLRDLEDFVGMAESLAENNRASRDEASAKLEELDDLWTPYEVVGLEDLEEFDPLPTPPEEDSRSVEDKLDDIFKKTQRGIKKIVDARKAKFDEFLENDEARVIASETMQRNRNMLMAKLDTSYRRWLELRLSQGKSTTEREPPSGYYSRRVNRGN